MQQPITINASTSDSNHQFFEISINASCYDNSQVPLLPSVIFQKIEKTQQSHVSKYSVAKRVGIVALSMGFGYATCIPLIKAALAFDSKKSVATHTISLIGAADNFLAFGTLATWGIYAMALELTKERSSDEIALFRKKIPLPLRIMHLASSLVGGVVARAPAFWEAIKFNNGIGWAIFNSVGESGVPAFSTYQLIDKWGGFLFEKTAHTLCSHKYQNEIQLTRCRKRIFQSLDAAIAATTKETQNQFSFLSSQSSSKQSAEEKIGCLFSELKTIHQAHEITLSTKKFSWIQFPRGFIRLSMLLPPLLFLYENWKMSQGTFEYIGLPAPLTYLLTVLSVLPMSYAAVDLTSQTAVTLFDQLTDLCCISREKSFTEHYFPILRKALFVGSTIISGCTFATVFSIANKVVPFNSYFGKAFVPANVSTLTLLMINSFLQLIDSSLLHRARQDTKNQDLHHAIQLKDFFEHGKQVLKECSLPHFAKLLTYIEDEEVKNWILGGDMTIAEIEEYVKLSESEKDPLLHI